MNDFTAFMYIYIIHLDNYEKVWGKSRLETLYQSIETLWAAPK